MNVNPTLLNQPEFSRDWQIFNQIFAELPSTGQVEQYVNGKQLACPMPLLKLKMALRDTPIGSHIYVTATDPNSQTDIGAFCQHMGYPLLSHAQTTPHGSQDTIFHLLITKNC